VIAYDPNNIEQSLLGDRIEDKLIGDNLLISDSYLIIDKNGKRHFVENTFNPKFLLT
jgi:hypothetical protein